jgi:hypothetical protein
VSGPLRILLRDAAARLLRRRMGLMGQPLGMRAACLRAWISGWRSALAFSDVITGLVPVIPIVWNAAPHRVGMTGRV